MREELWTRETGTNTGEDGELVEQREEEKIGKTKVTHQT
jgi:hypothetical protein